ncbi:AMP-binding protein [Pikeienuella sp. HZG-20]|uniref:AMP-binding protein n=1 Tax=Paludibacillus litoralis TaxID=3133267 RepID=UPI0030ECA112
MSDFRDRLLASAERHAGRPALWADGAELTYDALFSRARRLAEAMDARLAPGGAIGIHGQRDLASLTGVLAVALSGRRYLPLNPILPRQRLEDICRLERPRAIIAAPETLAGGRELMAALPGDVLLLSDEGEVAAHGGAPNAPAPDESGDQALYTLFTSGTTGAPKGVRVLDANVGAYIDGVAPIADLTPEDRATHFFDLSFDLSAHDIFVTFLAGAQLNIAPRERNMEIVEFIAERRITSWFSVPSLAAFCGRLGQLEPGALGGLRTALFCGEPLPVALARRFAAAAPGARLWNTYGPTEATIAFTAYEFTPPDRLDGLTVVPLGAPIGDQRCAIDGGGEAGELLLGGSQVTPGYVNNPELNETRFFTDEDGVRFYRSGDLVTRSAEHGYLFNGRIDDQVKINGYRVELLEIDAVCRDVSGALEVAAIPWPSAAPDHVVAFVVGSETPASEIRRKCRRFLPAYMTPRKIIALDCMPTTPSGKIDRKALARTLTKPA